MPKPTKILLYMSWVSEEKGFLEGSCLLCWESEILLREEGICEGV